jgi:deoxycytidine triphosphate deaminase
MQLLTDGELKALLASAAPPILGVKPDSPLDTVDSQIQPCSVDLRINEIYLPMPQPELGGEPRSTLQHELKVGESARVSTIEKFALANDFAAIVFAPARLSRKGIVVPDIGHIDPGFDGSLRMTLINMGRDPYELRHEDTVATVLLFKLDKKCESGLCERKGRQPYAGGLDDVRHLAPDFLNISGTTKLTAKQEAERLFGTSGWRYVLYSVFAPILIGIAVAFVGYWAQVQYGLESFKVRMEAKVDSLDKATDAQKELLHMQADYARSEAETNSRFAEMQRQIDQFSKSRAPPAQNH